MVAVRFELEDMDETVAQCCVQKTLRFYQQALNGVTCPTHDSSPSLVVRGNTMSRLAVSISACCAELLATADARVRAVSRREEDL